jgi:hypothetical protein
VFACWTLLGLRADSSKPRGRALIALQCCQSSQRLLQSQVVTAVGNVGKTVDPDNALWKMWDDCFLADGVTVDTTKTIELKEVQMGPG